MGKGNEKGSVEPQKKKGFDLKKTLIAIAVIIILGFFAGSGKDKDTKKDSDSQKAEQETSKDTNTQEPDDTKAEADFILDVSSLSDGSIGTAIDTGNLQLIHGELLSVIYGGDGVIVVKAKIEPSYSNKATIDQNYFSVCDLIKNHGFNSCSELQYWAVADMSDGSESKVISFTLNSDTIQGVLNESIVENQLGEHAVDLYILPSLQE